MTLMEEFKRALNRVLVTPSHARPVYRRPIPPIASQGDFAEAENWLAEERSAEDRKSVV